jgi:hypothetical protein
MQRGKRDQRIAAVVGFTLRQHTGCGRFYYLNAQRQPDGEEDAGDIE